MEAVAHDPFTLAYHELRAPLGLVVTAARTLADDSVDDVLKRRCEVIARTAERMLRTTMQVFDLARVSGSGSVDWFSTTEVLAQLTRDLSGFAIEIELIVDPAVGDARVLQSRGVFEALAQSLISNAIDHSDPGAVVVVHVGGTDDELAISIANPVSTARGHDGLGVGMYLSGRLAEQLGGSVRAEREDHLYCVRLRFPRSAGD